MVGLFVCQFAHSRSLTVNQWIDVFNAQDIQIITSSDYLTQRLSETDFYLGNDTISDFNQALKSISLHLITVDNNTYVIRPFEKFKPLKTGLIIKAIESETGQSIENFRVKFKQKTHASKKSIVLLYDLGLTNVALELSALGYYSVNHSASIKPQTFNQLTLQLKAKPISIDEITVTASRVNIQSPFNNKNTFAREDLQKSIILGDDPLRASHNIAGSTNNGISGKSNTRGGKENESLIVLDNHVLRNPFHFKNLYSLFSTINLTVVDNIDFYSGVFPMQYGGRLSSVTDIKTSDFPMQPKQEIGLDFFNSYYAFRSNNEDYSKSFQTSLRSGGHLINDHIIKDNIIRPEFDDVYIKSFQQINDKWSTSQHLLLSRDEIRVDDTEVEKENSLITGELANSKNYDQNLWFQLFFDNGNNINANLQLYASRKHDLRDGFVINNESQSSLKENILTHYYGIKFQQSYHLNHAFLFDYGVDLSNEDTQISSQRIINDNGDIAHQLGLQNHQKNHFNFKNNGVTSNLFVNTRYKYSNQLIFDLGVRFEYKKWIENNILSPRFNLSYFYDNKTTYRFALGRHQQSQYIDELLLEDQSPNYYDPTSADMAVFELMRTINSHLSLRAEFYVKKYSSTQPYYENIFNNLHIIPDLYFDRIKVSPDDSSASGLELTLKGIAGQTNWSASYIYSDVDDTLDEISVARSWDQHNALKFAVNIPFSIKYINAWELDINANYHSGWAKTEIIETSTGLEIAERNSAVFKDYYQLDLKLSKTHRTNKGTVQFAMQVNNLFNTRNICCINYELNGTELLSKQKSWLPITPNLSIKYLWD